jgi:hypothetical protein
MPRSCVAERDLRIPPSPYSDTRFDRKIQEPTISSTLLQRPARVLASTQLENALSFINAVLRSVSI